MYNYPNYIICLNEIKINQFASFCAQISGHLTNLQAMFPWPNPAKTAFSRFGTTCDIIKSGGNKSPAVILVTTGLCRRTIFCFLNGAADFGNPKNRSLKSLTSLANCQINFSSGTTGSVIRSRITEGSETIFHRFLPIYTR